MTTKFFARRLRHDSTYEYVVARQGVRLEPWSASGDEALPFISREQADFYLRLMFPELWRLGVLEVVSQAEVSRE